MIPLQLTGFTLTNALGCGIDVTRQALLNNHSGLRRYDFDDAALPMFIGRVKEIDTLTFPSAYQDYACRNHYLAYLALQQDHFMEKIAKLKKQYSSQRIGLFLGTSTSGILETELVYRNYLSKGKDIPATYHYATTHDNFALAQFVSDYCDLDGPVFVVSTACSSSAKVFADASRFIQSGFCDAAIVGGVDSLCYTTLYGFSALELISPFPCQPADKNRRGISIGEAAGFAILEKKESISLKSGQINLLGYGESSDAYHMATPDPTGKGMAKAMQLALQRASCSKDMIDYVNLHGTATKSNDLAEDKALLSVLGKQVPCSSTKGWTGHTLGAAGITEILISAILLQEQWIPKSLHTEVVDPAIEGYIILQSYYKKMDKVMSNSFGFGGNNCSVILGLDV